MISMFFFIFWKFLIFGRVWHALLSSVQLNHIAFLAQCLHVHAAHCSMHTAQYACIHKIPHPNPSSLIPYSHSKSQILYSIFQMPRPPNHQFQFLHTSFHIPSLKSFISYSTFQVPNYLFHIPHSNSNIFFSIFQITSPKSFIPYSKIPSPKSFIPNAKSQISNLKS